jgi:DNA-binding transcriptional MerR regulator
LDNDNIQDTDFEEVTDEQKTIRGKRLYLSTSQVATLLGEPDSKIRYYSNVFDDILKIEISNKQRRYTDQDIDKLRFIIDLKSQGMTIKQILQYCDEVSFEEGTGITIKESNPLSIQAMATELMEEQHKQMLEFKGEIINLISEQLENQTNIIKANNEILKENIIEQVAITVDDVISEKLNTSLSEFKGYIDKKELEAKNRDKELTDNLNKILENKKKHYEEKQEIKKHKGFLSNITNIFHHK